MVRKLCLSIIYINTNPIAYHAYMWIDSQANQFDGKSLPYIFLLGVNVNGANEQYFRDSSLSTMQAMYEFMTNRGTLQNSAETAIEKVW